jgi:fluoroquinolone transport system ATP-binding protein
MSMIDVSNLSYTYKKGTVKAVNDVSFQIGKGEIFGFLGPSGAGKSTTQAILAGLLSIQSGTISIDGNRRSGSPGKDFFNRIGMGFEIPNVYKKLSGLDNLNSTLSSTTGRPWIPWKCWKWWAWPKMRIKKPVNTPRA